MPGITDVGAALEKDGAQVLCVKTDVSNEESANNMVAKAVEKFGRIDYAANCAGIMDARKFSDAKPSDVSGCECTEWRDAYTTTRLPRPSKGTDADTKWDRVLGINARGVFLCMRAELKQMGKQDPLPDASLNPNRKQRGSIVNVASTMGERAIPLTSMYTASKHAEIGLAKTAALEFAQEGIRM